MPTSVFSFSPGAPMIHGGACSPGDAACLAEANHRAQLMGRAQRALRAARTFAPAPAAAAAADQAARDQEALAHIRADLARFKAQRGAPPAPPPEAKISFAEIYASRTPAHVGQDQPTAPAPTAQLSAKAIYAARTPEAARLAAKGQPTTPPGQLPDADSIYRQRNGAHRHD